jgi:hypothetical protein
MRLRCQSRPKVSARSRALPRSWASIGAYNLYMNQPSLAESPSAACTICCSPSSDGISGLRFDMNGPVRSIGEGAEADVGMSQPISDPGLRLKSHFRGLPLHPPSGPDRTLCGPEVEEWPHSRPAVASWPFGRSAPCRPSYSLRNLAHEIASLSVGGHRVPGAAAGRGASTGSTDSTHLLATIPAPGGGQSGLAWAA